MTALVTGSLHWLRNENLGLWESAKFIPCFLRTLYKIMYILKGIAYTRTVLKQHLHQIVSTYKFHWELRRFWVPRKSTNIYTLTTSPPQFYSIFTLNSKTTNLKEKKGIPVKLERFPCLVWPQGFLDSAWPWLTSGCLGLTVRLVLSPFKIWFKSRRERSANSPLANFWSSLHPICLVQTLLDTCRITARSGLGGSISAGRGSPGDPWWHTYLASTRLMKHWLALSPPLVIVLTITVTVHKRNVNFLTDR